MSQETLNSFIFDRNLLLQRRSQIVDSLSKADFLIKRSFDNIQERLNEMSRDFPVILNLGCRNGYGSHELINRFGTKKLIETDLSVNLLKQSPGSTKIIVDEENLNLSPNQFDLIISVLNLHSVNDLPGCLIQLKNALKPNGLLIASMFGERNLYELRETLVQTELECIGGISPRMMPYVELKQLGSLLQRAGFSLPVVDSDRVETHYQQPLDLLHDLQNMGETNIMLNRSKAYLGKKFWHKFAQNYINRFSINDSEVIATFEILTLTGIKN